MRLSHHAIALGGPALHLGSTTSAVLRACTGPVVIEQAGVLRAASDMRVQRTDRGVTICDPSSSLRVDLAEHLFAALGGLGIRRGLRIAVYGTELPLLDGGAHAWTRAVQSLDIKPSPASHRITRSEVVAVGDATFELIPLEGIELEVHIDFDHQLVQQKCARWNGAASDFAARIAPARTFGFLSEASRLWAMDRARGANTTDVIVLCDDGSTLTTPRPAPDECARHKLLDLIGDLSLACGLPLGKIVCERPGHSATHEMVRIALRTGAIATV